MRTFKRLFPILALVLLTSVALARPAGLSGTGRGPAMPVSDPQSCNHPGSLQLDFGTVVRDTADEQGIHPNGSQMPFVLRQQAWPGWFSYFMRNWISDLLPR